MTILWKRCWSKAGHMKRGNTITTFWIKTIIETWNTVARGRQFRLGVLRQRFYGSCLGFELLLWIRTSLMLTGSHSQSQRMWITWCFTLTLDALLTVLSSDRWVVFGFPIILAHLLFTIDTFVAAFCTRSLSLERVLSTKRFCHMRRMREEG